MKWYFKVLSQYADFSGRARRKEYWMFVLFNIIFSILAIVLDNASQLTLWGLPYGVFYFLYNGVILLPGLAVIVRRLHDIGKSGGMIFIVFVPIIGGLWLLTLMCMDSEPSENKYGLNPKQFPKVREEQRTKSAAVTLIVGSSLWIIQILYSFIQTIIKGYFHESALFNNLIIIVPISLIVLGRYLLSQSKNKVLNL